MYLYLSDGGLVEDLGVVQLLRRHCRWILSIDAGDDPQCELLDLRAAIALARKDRICSFYDKEDPRRDLEEVLQRYIESHNPYLHLGVLYSSAAGRDSQANLTAEIGEIFHVRMRLLECDDSVPALPLIQHEDVRLLQYELPQISPLQPSLLTGHPAQADTMQPAPHPLQDDLASPWLHTRDANVACPTPQISRRRLGGACCHCCHESAPCTVCGTFPNTHTANQFFTPVLWANFCRLGRELAGSAIAALSAAQLAEARAGG